MTYPHDKLVRAWLKGIRVQYRVDGQWRTMDGPDVADKMPHFYRDEEYRLEPRTIRVRHAFLVINGVDRIVTAMTLQEEKEVSSNTGFVKWLDDWTEITA